MGKVTSGVFPVNVNQFEVNVGTTEEEWVTVAELEECTVTIDIIQKLGSHSLMVAGRVH